MLRLVLGLTALGIVDNNPVTRFGIKQDRPGTWNCMPLSADPPRLATGANNRAGSRRAQNDLAK